MFVDTNTHVHTCTQKHTRTHIHKNTRTYMYTHIHTLNRAGDDISQILPWLKAPENTPGRRQDGDGCLSRNGEGGATYAY